MRCQNHDDFTLSAKLEKAISNSDVLLLLQLFAFTFLPASSALVPWSISRLCAPALNPCPLYAATCCTRRVCSSPAARNLTLHKGPPSHVPCDRHCIRSCRDRALPRTCSCNAAAVCGAGDHAVAAPACTFYSNGHRMHNRRCCTFCFIKDLWHAVAVMREVGCSGCGLVDPQCG
jgi:hypothetical protein